MLSKVKKCWLGSLFAVFIAALLAFPAGLYRVQDKMVAVDSLKPEPDKVAIQEIRAELDKAVKQIDERTTQSKESLEVIVNDARKERTGAPVPVPAIVRIESQPTAQAADAGENHKAGPSESTLHTIDLLWEQYCANFPRERQCQEDGRAGVRTSPATEQGGGKTVNRS